MHCRWRFVIHPGIDGYSRLPVYCHCSTDNRAQTVLQLFQGAVDMYGLPSRVRCDRGVENYDNMLSHPQRGLNCESIIAGQSVHNQRIERFWRDFFVAVFSITSIIWRKSVYWTLSMMYTCFVYILCTSLTSIIY
jgi:hypothetical protein